MTGGPAVSSAVSAGMLAAVTEASGATMVALDAEDRVTLWTPAAERLLGWTCDDVVGRRNPAVPAARRSEHDILRGRVLAGDRVADVTTEWRTQAGERLPVSLSGVPVRDDAGAAIGAVLTVELAPERTERDRTLERYKSILRTVPVGVLVLDSEARVEWANDALWTALGTTRAAVIGRPFREFIEDGSVDASVVESYLGAVETLLSSTDRDRVVIEFQVDRADADGVRDYEGYIGLRRPASEGFAGTVNTFLDVTDRKERERELEQYRTAMETVPDGVFLLDECGTMIRVNEAWAATVGYDADDLIGEPFAKLVADGVVHERAVEQYIEVLRGFLSGTLDPCDAVFRTTITPPNADEDHVYEVHIGLFAPDGAFSGAAGVVRDVTDHVEQRRELEQQNDRLEEFASIVSHDLRNPLNVARGWVDVAERTGDTTNIGTAGDALDRMADIIEDVLTLAKQGAALGEVGVVDLAATVETCWSNVESDGAALAVDDDLPPVEADRSRLARLFENLFRNAVEHGGSDVTVRVGALDDGLGFYVEDDGAGVAPADREVVFEYGYSGSPGGTGFGLAIVRQVAEAHGWDVTAVDGADGGARFDVRTTGRRHQYAGR